MRKFRGVANPLSAIFRTLVGATFSLSVIFMFIWPNPAIVTVVFAGFMISLLGTIVTGFIVNWRNVLRRLSEFSNGSGEVAGDVFTPAAQSMKSSRLGNILAVVLAIAIVVVVVVVGLAW